MVSHVLATVVEYRLSIVYMVLNDFAYGAIVRPQRLRFGEGYSWFSEFRYEAEGETYPLDFAKLAQAYGMDAEVVGGG